MESFRDIPGDDATPVAPPNDVAAAIGTDERRMHVRAYNYWVSLLDGRDFPSIEDLEPGNLQDFSAHSVLLDFTCGGDNPAIPYVGAAIRDECGLNDDMRTIADVPSRSLLSRLTDHYMQIIANRAPVGFEAEFDNPVGEAICYRGILMPFSSDGDSIDFIYGVINWKRVDEDGPAAAFPPEPAALDAPLELSDTAETTTDEPLELSEFAEPTPDEPLELTDTLEISLEEPVAQFAEPLGASDEFIPPALWGDETFEAAEDDIVPQVTLDDSAGLADRLWAARETADAVKAGEGRTRAALYRALSLAYDFAIAARDNPEEYAELLEESGVKAQVRAPMTPIVKLVFGVDYDKARLTEFAAALSFAQRQEIALGTFEDFIQKQPGGLKALVAAEREARRPEPKRDTRGEAARARLRTAPSISLAEVPAEEEFALVVTRRGLNGTHEVIAVVEDEALVERAIRRVA